MNLNSIFIDFGSQNRTQKIGRSDLFASLKGCLEPSWPQVVTFSDFLAILGSLGCLLGLSWDGFGPILAALCAPWGALGVYFGYSLALRCILGPPWATEPIFCSPFALGATHWLGCGGHSRAARPQLLTKGYQLFRSQINPGLLQQFSLLQAD